MNDSELKKVLARIAVADKRSVDQVTLAHWRECIGHLRYDDSMQAITTHFQNSTDYLMPAHVIQGAEDIARARARGEILAKPCEHRFDETSGYCNNCGIRDDQAA